MSLKFGLHDALVPRRRRAQLDGRFVVTRAYIRTDTSTARAAPKVVHSPERRDAKSFENEL